MISMDVKLIVDVVFLFLIVIVTLATVVSHHLVRSTVLLSIMSLLVALMYLVLGAPDVAITEAAVGAGVSTLLMLAALIYTGVKEDVATVGSRVAGLFTVFATGGILLYATIDMPNFGSADAPSQLHLAPYFITESLRDIAIPNIVTSILASYRGFDTLGEVFVIFTAGLSVALMLSGTVGRKTIQAEDSVEERDEAYGR